MASGDSLKTSNKMDTQADSSVKKPKSRFVPGTFAYKQEQGQSAITVTSKKTTSRGGSKTIGGTYVQGKKVLDISTSESVTPDAVTVAKAKEVSEAGGKVIVTDKGAIAYGTRGLSSSQREQISQAVSRDYVYNEPLVQGSGTTSTSTKSAGFEQEQLSRIQQPAMVSLSKNKSYVPIYGGQGVISEVQKPSSVPKYEQNVGSFIQSVVSKGKDALGVGQVVSKAQEVVNTRDQLYGSYDKSFYAIKSKIKDAERKGVYQLRPGEGDKISLQVEKDRARSFKLLNQRAKGASFDVVQKDGSFELVDKSDTVKVANELAAEFKLIETMRTQPTLKTNPEAVKEFNAKVEAYNKQKAIVDKKIDDLKKREERVQAASSEFNKSVSVTNKEVVKLAKREDQTGRIDLLYPKDKQGVRQLSKTFESTPSSRTEAGLQPIVKKAFDFSERAEAGLTYTITGGKTNKVVSVYKKPDPDKPTIIFKPTFKELPVQIKKPGDSVISGGQAIESFKTGAIKEIKEKPFQSVLLPAAIGVTAGAVAPVIGASFVAGKGTVIAGGVFKLALGGATGYYVGKSVRNAGYQSSTEGFYESLGRSSVPITSAVGGALIGSRAGAASVKTRLAPKIQPRPDSSGKFAGKDASYIFSKHTLNADKVGTVTGRVEIDILKRNTFFGPQIGRTEVLPFTTTISVPGGQQQSVSITKFTNFEGRMIASTQEFAPNEFFTSSGYKFIKNKVVTEGSMEAYRDVVPGGMSRPRVTGKGDVVTGYGTSAEQVLFKGKVDLFPVNGKSVSYVETGKEISPGLFESSLVKSSGSSFFEKLLSSKKGELAWGSSSYGSSGSYGRDADSYGIGKGNYGGTIVGSDVPPSVSEKLVMTPFVKPGSPVIGLGSVGKALVTSGFNIPNVSIGAGVFAGGLFGGIASVGLSSASLSGVRSVANVSSVGLTDFRALSVPSSIANTDFIPSADSISFSIASSTSSSGSSSRSGVDTGIDSPPPPPPPPPPPVPVTPTPFVPFVLPSLQSFAFPKRKKAVPGLKKKLSGSPTLLQMTKGIIPSKKALNVRVSGFEVARGVKNSNKFKLRGF